MATKSSTFWLVSAPSEGGAMFSKVQGNTGGYSTCHRVNIPKLRAGTLDSLMTLSDDLGKHDQQVEGALRKIERQMLEFGESDFTIQVERNQAVTTEDYVTDFKWAANKYQDRLTLPEIATKIYQDAVKVDDELRTKQVDFNAVKTALAAQDRKQKGTLAVRSLHSLGLNYSSFIDTENFVTVGVVVPKSDDKQWLQSYELGVLDKEANLGFSPVLIGSSRKVFDKDDQDDLWSVTLFKRKLQDFKNALREKHPRWAVREFTYDESQLQDEQAQMDQVKQQEEKARKNLTTWCKAMHGEVFRAYVHLKVVRVFVESALRFGVPPDFQVVVLKPNPKHEKTLREILQRQFKHLGNSNMYGTMDETAPGGVGNQEFYPYVFLTMNVSHN